MTHRHSPAPSCLPVPHHVKARLKCYTERSRSRKELTIPQCSSPATVVDENEACWLTVMHCDSAGAASRAALANSNMLTGGGMVATDSTLIALQQHPTLAAMLRQYRAVPIQRRSTPVCVGRFLCRRDSCSRAIGTRVDGRHSPGPCPSNHARHSLHLA